MVALVSAHSTTGAVVKNATGWPRPTETAALLNRSPSTNSATFFLARRASGGGGSADSCSRSSGLIAS